MNIWTDWRTKHIVGRPWQDLVFAAGEVVFLLTLIPLIVNDVDVPILTGVGSALMLYIFMLAHISYSNWITVALTWITATLWLLIGIGIHF